MNERSRRGGDGTSYPVSESSILLAALAWLLIVLGAMYLARGTLLTIDFNTEHFITGLWKRTIESHYQFILVAAVISILPHFLWVYLRSLPTSPAIEYELFASWGQTVFTSFGFLGTVVGISSAVSGLEQAMLKQDPTELISGLSIAFDTTFIGLVGALALLFFRKAMPAHRIDSPPKR